MQGLRVVESAVTTCPWGSAQFEGRTVITTNPSKKHGLSGAVQMKSRMRAKVSDGDRFTGDSWPCGVQDTLRDSNSVVELL